MYSLACMCIPESAGSCFGGIRLNSLAGAERDIAGKDASLLTSKGTGAWPQHVRIAYNLAHRFSCKRCMKSSEGLMSS